MTKTAVTAAKVLLFAAIGMGLLWLTYRDKDLGQMWRDISQANFLWIAASFCCGYVAIISRGLRWGMLLRPLGYSLRRPNAVHAVAVGYFANMGIPRSGELVRCTVLSRAEDIPVDRLFGTVILERVIDTFMLLIVASTALLLNLDTFRGFFALAAERRATAPTADGDASNLWIFIALGLLLIGLLVAWRFLRHSAFEHRLRVIARGIREGIVSITKLQQRGLFIFHTCFIWFNYFLSAWFCFLSLPETAELGIPAALFVMVAGGLGIIVPTPGGAGSYHAAVTLAFVALAATGTAVLGAQDTAEAIGAKYAAIAWTTQTLMMIITGFVGLILLSLASKKKNT